MRQALPAQGSADQHGAESIDAARDAVIVSAMPKRAVRGPDKDFADAEALYGGGSRRPWILGAASLSEAVPYLRDLYPDIYAQHNFIAGYERGRIYQQYRWWKSSVDP